MLLTVAKSIKYALMPTFLAMDKDIYLRRLVSCYVYSIDALLISIGALLIRKSKIFLTSLPPQTPWVHWSRSGTDRVI